MIKVLIFDVDDTLIARGQGLVQESALAAVCKAKQQGYKVIVATGRGYYLMQPDIKERFPADYLITVNGTCINRKDGTVLKTYPMSSDDCERLIQECLYNDYSFGFKFDDSFQVYNKYEEFVANYCSPGITRDMIDNNVTSRNYHLTHGLPLGCFIYSDNNDAFKLKSTHPNLTFVEAGKKNGSCECFDACSNKGRSIGELVDYMGYSLDECMAFGDSENDLDMLKMCKIGVAMGNAKEEVKAVADYVTTNIYEDGIFNALKYFEII